MNLLTPNFWPFTRKDESEVNNFYNEDYVSQHDLLRELAIFESRQGPEGQRQRLIMDISGNSLPSWCTEQDQQPINARLLSISTGLFMFPSITQMHKHECRQYMLSAISHRI